MAMIFNLAFRRLASRREVTLKIHHRFHTLNGASAKKADKLFRELTLCVRGLEDAEDRLGDVAERYLTQIEDAKAALKRELLHGKPPAEAPVPTAAAAPSSEALAPDEDDDLNDVDDEDHDEEERAFVARFAKVAADIRSGKLTLDRLSGGEVAQLEVALQRAELALCRIFMAAQVTSNMLVPSHGQPLPRALERFQCCRHAIDLLLHELETALESGLHLGGLGARLQQLHACVLAGQTHPSVHQMQLEITEIVVADISGRVKELDAAIKDIEAVFHKE